MLNRFAFYSLKTMKLAFIRGFLKGPIKTLSIVTRIFIDETVMFEFTKVQLTITASTPL